jgi:hypothetical protein
VKHCFTFAEYSCKGNLKIILAGCDSVFYPILKVMSNENWGGFKIVEISG